MSGWVLTSAFAWLSLGLAVALPFGLFGGRAKEASERGAQAYEAGDGQRAAEAFSEGLGDYPRSPELQYNLGVSQYRSGEFDAARATLEAAAEAAEASGDAALAERALFAAGNALFRQGRYQEAIGAYDRALELEPDDAEAQENRDLAERMLQQPPPPPPTPQQSQQQQEESDSPGSESEPQTESEGGSESQAPSDAQEEGSSEEEDPQAGASQRIPQPPPGVQYPPMPDAQADDLLEGQRERERMGAATLQEGGDPLEADLERMLRGLMGEPTDQGTGKPPW